MKYSAINPAICQKAPAVPLEKNRSAELSEVEVNRSVGTCQTCLLDIV